MIYAIRWSLVSSILSHSEESPHYVYENKTLQHNMNGLLEKASTMINKEKKEENFDEIEIQISGLLHLLAYFQIQIGLLYPLKDTILRLKQSQPNADVDVISSHVTYIDITCKKSFIVLTAFTFETILKFIAEKYGVSFPDKKISLTKKYCVVMEYFGVEIGERAVLLDIFHWTRNTLHHGGKVTQENHLKYKGGEFHFIPDQEMKHADWDYFTYFVGDIIDIFRDILKSPKFTKK